MRLSRAFIRFSLALLVLTFESPRIAVGEEAGKEQTSDGSATEITSGLPPGAVEEMRLFEEETVVSAIRHEQPISKAPSNVYVVTDEDIRRSGAVDLPTLLRRIPGMEVMQPNGADFNVSVRGDNSLGAARMLVLVDGRSIYQDVQGVVFWKAIPVTLPEIKRIEVIKGPASAVYGFNAFDGVVNIITKSPNEIKGTTLQFGGGAYGTITSAAIQAGTHGKLGYRLSLGRDQNQQWGDGDALAFRTNKFNVQTEYAVSGTSKLVVSGGLVDANKFDGLALGPQTLSGGIVNAYTNVVYEQPDFFVRAWWYGLDSTTAVVPVPLLAPFVTITDLSGNPNLSIDANTYNIEGQHALQLGNANRLTYGVNYRHNTLSTNFADQFLREDRLGFYLHHEWRGSERVSIVAGVRYDLHSEIHGTWSPRLSVLYNPVPDHTFRATLTVAYRPPTLNETYLDAQLVAATGLPPPFPPTLTVPATGSRNLVPEQIVSYDVGYQGWFLRHRLRVRTDLFFNHISNLVANRVTGSLPSFQIVTVNGGGADIYGGEASVEFLVTRWLSGFANYAYQEFGTTAGGELRRGGPRYKFNAGLRGEWQNGFSAEVLYHYYGAVTTGGSSTISTAAALSGMTPPSPLVGSYNLLNLRGAYRFWQDKAEVAVSAFNALNDRHKEHPLGDIIGSRVMGWLTLRY